MQNLSIPTLPPTGFLRLPQIIGTKSKAQAKEEKLKKRKTQPVIYPPLIPVCSSTWWNGVKSGRYPRPLKLSPRVTVWRVEDIRALIESAQEVAV